MANQNQATNERRQFFIRLLFLWVAMYLMMWVFFRPTPPPRQPVAELYAAAVKAEQENVNAPVDQVSRKERLDRYEKILRQYQQVRQHDPKGETGINAYVAELRVLNRMLELSPGQTRYYDRQEQLLKEIERGFHRRSARLILDLDGRAREVNDVGQWAQERLNEVRAARDKEFQKKWHYHILAFLVDLTGRSRAFSYWFAIVLLTVALKALLWPFNRMQFQNMRDMQRIQPQLKELQEELKRKGRPPEEISRRIMQFYREQGVSPLGGCLPALLQMAILIPVFVMIRTFEYQFTNGYFLWINPELGSKFWWIGKNLAAFDVPLFLVYLGSMIAYSLLQPKPADPDQASTQKMMMILMPVMFGVMMWMWQWSSAFMLYWLVQNLLSMWQNWALLRQPTPAPAAAVSEPLPPMRGQPGTNGRRNPRRRSGATRPRR